MSDLEMGTPRDPEQRNLVRRNLAAEGNEEEELFDKIPDGQMIYLMSFEFLINHSRGVDLPCLEEEADTEEHEWGTEATADS